MSDLVDLRKLKNLIAVAEEGNITRAAKRLYLSQPALSAQMKDLEEAVQVSLLVRDRKGVRATPAAEILIAGGRHLLKLRDDLLATARAAHSVSFLPMRLPMPNYKGCLSLLWAKRQIENRPTEEDELLQELDPDAFTLRRKNWPR